MDIWIWEIQSNHPLRKKCSFDCTESNIPQAVPKSYALLCLWATILLCLYISSVLEKAHSVDFLCILTQIGAHTK